MPSVHVIPSGGLLTHQFLEALQQPTFNHPAVTPETFALPGRKAPSAAELDRAIGVAWELLVERWDSLERELPRMDISTLRTRWILPLFNLLDLELEYQRADLVLDEDLRFPISHMAKPAGVAGAEASLPVHTVLPVGDGLDTRRDSGAAGNLKRLSPHDLLQRYLNLSRDATWGLLCDGLHLRLLRDYHHTYARGYVEFDLQGIFSTRDVSAFRALYRLCHASRYLPMQAPTLTPAAAASAAKRRKPKVEDDEELVDEGEVEEETIARPLTPLDSFYQHALSTGVRVGEDLRNNVRSSIETLANGFLLATPGFLDRVRQGGNDSTHALYDDVLHVIYRVLFLLFAEQRGMLPGRGSLYMDEFSLTALRTRAERPVGDDPHVDLWERLKTTFHMVERGVPELGVFGYDGALFSAARTLLLTPMDEDATHPQPSIANSDLLQAVRALTTIERGGVLQRISYADLSVEEMGSVYESLLDYTARIADHAEILEEEGQARREIHADQFFLDPRGKERKTTGSYYTHPSLVNELIRTALLPVLKERLGAATPGYDSDHPEQLSTAQRADAEAALLMLKVIDPAAGSGAFLIAADNVLGLRLAQIRSGDIYPAEHEIRRARRDVLAHCLYAVDLNPMAVELCKLSLWINAAVEDQKLNFLDHHIKCGNSLVGARRDLVRGTVPTGAFQPITGDDAAVSRLWRDSNARQRPGQLTLFRVIELREQGDLRRWLELTRLAEDDPALAEEQYNAFLRESGQDPERIAADLWTSAFFWPLKAGAPPPPTTESVSQALADPRLISQPQIDLARSLARAGRFFHWELEFPDVYGLQNHGGFDVVLGNPPWERIKLQEKEFFEGKDDAIANAPNAASRRRLIQQLPQTNPALWAAYQKALRESEGTSKFLRASGRYPLSARGDINTYQVFAEHDRVLIAKTGRAGIIVPSGIATDFSNKDFFADLIETSALASLYDFENRRGIFPGVHRSYKFCLLTMRGAGSQSTEPPEFAFFLLDVDDLNDPEKRFTLTAEDFDLLNPNTRTCPIFRTRRDAELTRKLYQAAPVLINEVTGKNSWGLSFNTMFHMANDSDLFRTREQLLVNGLIEYGNAFILDDEVFLPLYEGKMFWHFDHRFGSFVGETTESPSIDLKRDSHFTIQPRYWISEDDLVSRLPDKDRRWFIAFRDITNVTNERTVIASIIPYSGVGHTAALILLPLNNLPFSGQLIANLNSFVFDYIARQKVGGTHLTYNYFKQLPILEPFFYPIKLINTVSPNMMELIHTSLDLDAFFEDFYEDANQELRRRIQNQWRDNFNSNSHGMEPNNVELIDTLPPFIWDETRRTLLRSELDGIFAHLYGLNRNEFAYILDTFPIVRRNDEATHGEYRTKRLCLEAYDRIAAGPDYEALIPAEARARSQESVIGLPASVVPPPARVAVQRETPVVAQALSPIVPPPQVVPSQPIADLESIPSSSQAAAPEVAPSSQLAQPPVLNEYGLYRCLACGKRLISFEMVEHTRQVHSGNEPGYVKLGK